MTDVFSQEKRSWIMSRVKGRDTKPEILVRSFIFRMGFRFSLYRRDLPGTPDLVLRRYNKVIFVHGCFWHGHKGCPRSKRPTTNENFWNNKLDGNLKRDKRYRGKLRQMGWKVLIVWECEIKSPEKLLRKLEKFLHDDAEKQTETS